VSDLALRAEAVAGTDMRIRASDTSLAFGADSRINACLCQAGQPSCQDYTDSPRHHDENWILANVRQGAYWDQQGLRLDDGDLYRGASE
jgi:hypothetical protein